MNVHVFEQFEVATFTFLVINQWAHRLHELFSLTCSLQPYNVYKHFQKSLQRELEDDLIIYLQEDNSRIYTEVTAV